MSWLKVSCGLDTEYFKFLNLDNIIDIDLTGEHIQFTGINGKTIIIKKDGFNFVIIETGELCVNLLM